MGYSRRVSLLVLLVCFSQALAVDFDAIAENIAKDLGDRLDTREYSTIAIWDIGNSGSVIYNEDDFLSRLKISLVRQRKFDVVDRTRLQQLLEEIEFTGSGLVDPDTMKRLGEMYGIDLFLYGTFYDNELAGEKNSTLILKGIDVERSYIAWAYEIPVYGDYLNTSLDSVISAVVKDLDDTKSYLASKGIRKISFWDLGNVPRQKELQVIDKLIVKLVRHGWQVVDRENLAKLLEEIRFTQDSGLISSATAQELGKMYGIDGFIYGRGTINFGGESELLLEMIDTEKGILPWAYNAVGTLEGAV
ncbi:MAG TPA: CsgG/HfaB family protein, partial [bacterium]|nr:CsgG/HfaB family protein [bacterium]